jgi:aquaporin rerated protein, other eukaryote
LALTLTRDLDPLRAVLLLITQISGACFAAYLVNVIFPSPFNVQTTLGAGTTVAQGVWIEALCTAELVFTIIMLAKEKHRATFIAPVGIGLALFIAELVAVYYTGRSLNPAWSFGPAAVAHSFTSHHWIYWVGRLVGSVLAVGFYQLMKILEYEMANYGQDEDVENDPTQNSDLEVAQNVQEREVEVEEIQAIEEEGGSAVPTDSLDNVTVAGFKPNGDLELRRKPVGGGYIGTGRNIGGKEAPSDLEAQWSVSAGFSSSEPSADAYIREKRRLRHTGSMR